MFDADRPIITSNQDRLNRTTFSKYLARCLLDHHDPDSMAVGLYGGWGVGKTSIINMVLEELNFATTNLEDKDKPIILNFSPWSYSGQKQLMYNFFRRLSSVLRNVNYLEQSDRIIYLLELYVSFFTHKPISKVFQKKFIWFQKFHRTSNDEIYAWESGSDLTLVKAELNDLLKNQNHKIIIIIDNISQLENYEIKQIFQIVKSIGDFANTVYLLAFDKHQVIQALNKSEISGAEEFIEKIIQLPFEIPPILQQDLENIFADKLQYLFTSIPEDAWRSDYWADIYYSSLRFLFENCRDITRYVNTLNFSYPRLREVVNPVDFFALTAIEVFIPDVYFGIRDNKDLFTDLVDSVYESNEDVLQKDKMRCDEILLRNNRVSREILLELLIRLFPRLRKIYYPSQVFFHSEAVARKLRRICSPDLFDAYFRLSMQTGPLPKTEFETILSLTDDAQIFDQALTRLNQDDRIIKFLDQLDGKFLEQIPNNNIGIIISALLDNGDLFPQGNDSQLSLNTPRRIIRIITTLLKRLNTTDERFEILQTAIANATKSIYIIIHQLQEMGREQTENEDEYLPLEFRLLTPNQLESLEQLAASRILVWAHNGRLAEHPLLLSILFAWLKWDPDKCQEYVLDLTSQDHGLVKFLEAALKEPINEAITKYEKNITWQNALENIRSFISTEQLIPHAKLIFEDPYFEKLREREQLAVMIFLDLVNAQTQKSIPQTS